MRLENLPLYIYKINPIIKSKYYNILWKTVQKILKSFTIFSRVLLPNEDQRQCFLCQTPRHQIRRCPKAVKMSRDEWKEICQRNERCFKCAKSLIDGHQTRRCPVRCVVCHHRGHFVAMCHLNSRRRTYCTSGNKISKRKQKRMKKKLARKLSNQSVE